MTDIAKSILALDPNAQVSVNTEDINQITWHDGNPNGITAEQIKAKQVELQDAYDNDYSRKRRDAYAAAIPIGDQLDAILKWANIMRMDGTNLPEDLDQVVSAWLTVKQKFPKS